MTYLFLSQVTIQSSNDIHQLTSCSQPQIPREFAANPGRMQLDQSTNQF